MLLEIVAAHFLVLAPADENPPEPAVLVRHARHPLLRASPRVQRWILGPKDAHVGSEVARWAGGVRRGTRKLSSVYRPMLCFGILDECGK